MAEPYRVDMLMRASKAFDAALAKLPPERRLPVLAATAKALQRLKDAPFEFGEELYDLKSIGLQVRVGIVLPVVIHYGADATNRIVIIHTAVIMS
jgi:hypothetical protein